MLFNSYDFMFFFPIVLLVYFVIPKKLRYIWLLIVSYYFYMGWNAKYAILLAISTVVTYICGYLFEIIDAKKPEKREVYRKIVLAAGCAINLGILGFFKYFDFIINNINSVVGRFGITVENRFDFLLPVGISFYTFQALSYMIDVYKGKIEAEKNILKYALFVSFFPQLVAGPIERSGNLLRQMKNVDKIKLYDLNRIFGGAILMLWGYFMKMVIADRASVFVNSVYGAYAEAGSIELIIGIVLFAIQIYCDFAGYSLIAIGAAKVMGFELMENFNTPFFASSIGDLWARWHISLSTWFKDYIYIPLGGSRQGKVKKYRNLFITFVVSGLWHGANWTYVLWGSSLGVIIIIEDILNPYMVKVRQKLRIDVNTLGYKLSCMAKAFFFFNVALIFFRAENVSAAITIFKNIVVKFDPWVLFDNSLYTHGLDMKEMHILILMIVVLLLVDMSRYVTGLSLDKVLFKQNLVFRWLVVFTLFFLVMIFGVYGPEFSAASFIYFQF